ncbi:hypothetical protein HYU06_00370 [Candidatus Woesearchaeota archaeon]|nr:hypothetical protein [Candidatus Woesearchaeota archaeon]
MILDYAKAVEVTFDQDLVNYEGSQTHIDGLVQENALKLKRYCTFCNKKR